MALSSLRALCGHPATLTLIALWGRPVGDAQWGRPDVFRRCALDVDIQETEAPGVYYPPISETAGHQGRLKTP